MLRHRLHCAGVTHRTRSHDMYWRHGVPALFRRTCAVRSCGSVSAVVHACRCAATATLSVAPSSPTASGTTSTLKPSPQQPPATAQSPRPPTPPPLSLLSWAVDGSGHTHHRCRRRLSMEERIPLICETIRTTAPDVVALQDSTSELAEALTNCPDESIIAKSRTPAPERRLRLYCAELARDLQQRYLSSALSSSSASAEPTEPLTTVAPLNADCHNQQSQTRGAPAPAANPLTVPAAVLPSCRYRLVGRARNGRCGEVQLFIKEDSLWDAQLLPGMGAGLTVELRSRIPAALPPRPLKGNAPTSDTASSEMSNPTSLATKQGGADAAGSDAELPYHRCVLTTVDLSYRGKSLGTKAEGLLAGAAISSEGSPFTLQTQQPSSLSAAKRHGRAPGHLDAHRAMALDWVYHHVRPDVLVGNLFTGTREQVPGFEDMWVRAGSPAGQERTTNTCARHRIDHGTNYFYFQPSRNVASPEAMKKLMRMDEASAKPSKLPSPPLYQSPAIDGGLGNAAAAGTARGQNTETASTTVAAVAADAPVGTPIPLAASRDSATGTWQLRSSSVCGGAPAEAAVHCNSHTVPSSAGHHLTDKDGNDDVCTSGDITVGMPEVAGRFQRCLLRGWVRRGPASRGGHLSAHPFLRQYRYCRVVVLRPTVEVDLSAAEQAWHTRYITAQYSTKKPTTLIPSATAESGLGEGDAASVAASQTTRAGEASSSLRQARVNSRVRCSVSEQYPLLTLLA